MVTPHGHPFNLTGLLWNNRDDFVYQWQGWDSSAPIVFKYSVDGIINATGRALIHNAFGELEEYINVDFQLTAESLADITFTELPANAIGGGQAFFNVWDLSAPFGELDSLESTVGIQALAMNAPTVIHEIGHALTLLHTSPFQSPPHEPFIESIYQNNDYTVMHYDIRNPNFVPSEGEWNYQHFQLFDIYALQVRFGVNEATGSGNTTYTAQDFDQWMEVLWDADGIDTINMSAQASNQVINLNEGAFSRVGPVWTQNPSPSGNNLSIAYGAVIEIAVGGSGNDTIYGNAVDNLLVGNEGSDTIFGGDGYDTAAFAGSRASYTIQQNGSQATVSNGLYTDTLVDIERLEFGDGEFILVAPQTPGLLTSLELGEQLQVIYFGYFNRAADGEGFEFWSDQNTQAQASGQGADEALTNIANSFQPQPETLALYPALGTANPDFSSPGTLVQLSDFIDDVYQNLFNRAPDAEGKSYWTGQISSGAVGFGAGILAIANGATGSDATIILNKAQVALDFTTSTSAAGVPVTPTFLAAAVAVLDGVDETDASVVAAMAETDSFIASQPSAALASLDVFADTSADAAPVEIVGIGHDVMQDGFM